jgi:GNAT superfamily N-acetyltransferase
MGEILAFTEEHANGVASLYFRAIRGQNRPPGKTLPKHFAEFHLANPWASPEIPALVYLEKGKVVGALGVLPRPMEFRGRPIVVATTTVFMVDPQHQGEPVGARLLDRLLSGPQDLSWTDGASGHVKAGWTALGGYAADLYAFNWIRILRPFGTASFGLDRLGRAGRWLKPVSRVAAVPLDLLLSNLPVPPLRPPVSQYGRKLVSADELLDCITSIGWRESLRPAYSSPSFQWLMREAAKAKYGDLRMVTVTNPEGVRSGWFVYYASPGGAAGVLQIGIRRRYDFKNTLAALFLDAWEQGSACIRGASIPQYLTALTEQHCFFRHPRDQVLIHSRNQEIARAIRLGEAALARLDGTFWFRFAGENWD